MKEIEKDVVVSGAPRDELKRCKEMLDSLEKAVSKLPKGEIVRRKKIYRGKEHCYVSIKHREGHKFVSKQIPNEDVYEVTEKLKLRQKYEKEINVCKKKIVCLNKIINSSKKGKGSFSR
ncbi:MAG: hypothetical protein HZA77_13855 [Candidatus Schekmanbacteria bacterium]|nr:hypothetical protein [Candidatus Schekmanbacteria bacterium]